MQAVEIRLFVISSRALLYFRTCTGTSYNHIPGHQFCFDTFVKFSELESLFIHNKSQAVSKFYLMIMLVKCCFDSLGADYLQAYNINTLNEVQNSTIKDLSDLGLVKLQQVSCLSTLTMHNSGICMLHSFDLHVISRVGRRVGSFRQSWLPLFQSACQIHRLGGRYLLKTELLHLTTYPSSDSMLSLT